MKSSNNKIDDSYIIADLKVKNNNNKFEMLSLLNYFSFDYQWLVTIVCLLYLQKKFFFQQWHILYSRFYFSS